MAETAAHPGSQRRKRILSLLCLTGIGIVIAEVGLSYSAKAAGLWRCDSRRIDQYLRTHEVRKLQIGAGTNNLAGWLNSDIEPGASQVYLDASAAFPLPSASFQYVFAEQVIEHMSYDKGLVMLHESYRILKRAAESASPHPIFDGWRNCSSNRLRRRLTGT